jgi:alpha-tubulin suppressor-like RCC1 family protein
VAFTGNLFHEPDEHFARITFAALACLTLTMQAAVAPRQPARRSAGEVLAWGRAASHEPVTVSNLGQIKAIAQGGTHSLALTTDGKVWAWGTNIFGQLGNGSNTASSVPVAVTNMASAVAIAAGDDHSLALTNDGKVWAWVTNALGIFGNGTNIDSNLPVLVSGLSGVASIAAVGVHPLVCLRLW